MRGRTKAVLLALIAVVALILMIALLRGCQQDTQTPEATVDPELPMDTSPLEPGQTGTAVPDATGESKPNIDPETGMELEQDELPIVVG